MTSPLPDRYYLTVELTGPTCTNCRRSEQRCAYLNCQCCTNCTHRFGEDGNTVTRVCPSCDQPFTLVQRSGRPKLTCGPCRLTALTAA